MKSCRALFALARMVNRTVAKLLYAHKRLKLQREIRLRVRDLPRGLTGKNAGNLLIKQIARNLFKYSE